jgi:hypothetical protein
MMKKKAHALKNRFTKEQRYEGMASVLSRQASLQAEMPTPRVKDRKPKHKATVANESACDRRNNIDSEDALDWAVSGGLPGLGRKR